MKKIKISSIRHISSVGLTLLFCFLSLASLDIPWWEEAENSGQTPCDQLNDTPLTYKCTIRASDKSTGDPIPNATVDLYLTRKSYTYIVGNTCVYTPITTVESGSTILTNESGFGYYEFTNVRFKTSLDKATITCSVHANNYSTAEVAVSLSSIETSVKIDVQIIDLSTQP